MTQHVAPADVAATVGVVGPSDLVDAVALLAAREYAQLTVRTCRYGNESQTVEVLRAAAPGVDAWLFTGVIPYTLARQAGVVNRPATFISYSGATLYRVLVEMLSAGRTWDVISIDTLDRKRVIEAFGEAGLSASRVRIMEYRADRDAAAFVRFHRAVARQAGSSVAISCVRSVYDEIAKDLPAVRLAPALASVRDALRTTALMCDAAAAADAQIVLGFVELSAPSASLRVEARRLAASVVPLDDKRYLLVTTRGVLAESTERFRRLPLLETLQRDQSWARVGLGVGRSAAEAETLARRALARAKSVGPFAATVSFGEDADIVLGDTTPEPVDGDVAVALAVAERRSGLSQHTLRRVKHLCDLHGGDAVTAPAVAHALGIEHRSARRILERLARAGVARTVDAIPTGTVGRPPKSYVVTLG